MAEQSSPKRFAETITDEHAELLTLLESLRSAVDSPRRDREAVQDLAQELADEIAEHFEHEEKGGYFSEALRRAPQLNPLAQHLLAEHEPLLETVEKLSTLARSGVESEAWWRRIDEQLLDFTARLHAHEAGERELIQRAYGEDIGCGD